MPLTVRRWPTGSSRAVVFNTEAAHAFLTRPEYRRQAMLANDVYCDGVGLQAYLLVRFGRVVRRRHGPDVFADYLGHREGARVLFLGGTTVAHNALRQLFPKFFERNAVTIDGTVLLDDVMEARAREVAGVGYDDVLIFLGLARQERMQDYLHAAGFGGASIGLGAAVDFVSGTKPRAGKVWQMIGLEWLPRLLRERRMWPRLLRSFAVFAMVGRIENAELQAMLFGAGTD